MDEEFGISSHTVSNQEISTSIHTADDFCLSRDVTVGVAEEGVPSPSSSQVYFQGEDFGCDGIKEDLVEKGHCYTPANCLKEGKVRFSKTFLP